MQGWIKLWLLEGEEIGNSRTDPARRIARIAVAARGTLRGRVESGSCAHRSRFPWENALPEPHAPFPR